MYSRLYRINTDGPVCLTGQGHPGQLAPADQRHPSPSGPPWFDPPPSLRHHSWQDHLPPVHKRQKHGGWGMSMRDIKQLWVRQRAKMFKTYLKKFADGPHKLSKKLLLLLIQGYSTDTWLHCSNVFSSTQIFTKKSWNFKNILTMIYLRGMETLGELQFAPWKCWQQMIWIPMENNVRHGKRLF